MSLEGPTTSTTFLERLRAGDAEAWDELVRVYSGPLLRLFRRLEVNDHDREALCQDVLGDVAQYFKTNTFDRSKGHFRGFLYTCAKNLFRKYGRRLGKLPKTGGDEGVLDSGVRLGATGLVEPEDQIDELHHQWFLEETVNSAVRRAIELTRAHFPESYRAFEITAVTVETRPDGDVYRVDLDRSDSELVARAAAELGWTNHKVSQEKSEIKAWFVARLRELVPEDV